MKEIIKKQKKNQNEILNRFDSKKKGYKFFDSFLKKKKKIDSLFYKKNYYFLIKNKKK